MLDAILAIARSQVSNIRLICHTLETGLNFPQEGIGEHSDC